MDEVYEDNEVVTVVSLFDEDENRDDASTSASTPRKRRALRVVDEDSDDASTSASTPKKRRALRGGDLSKTEKIKHREQKFRSEWMNDDKFKLWLRPLMNDPYKAKCTLCQTDFKSEITIIKRHMCGQKHKQRLANANPKSRSIMEGFKINPNEKTLVEEAEIKLSAFAAAHNISFLTMDHLSLLMKECFPDSNIAKQLHVKRTKAKNIIKNVIGETEKSEIVEELKTTPFSILMDESTDIGCVKSACVVVRYYSKEDGGIVSRFYELAQVFSANDAQGADVGATGERLFNLAIDCFKKHNIPFENIVGFGSDNCNTMMGVNNSVASRLKELCPNITILGCICHSIHLCASAACKELPRTPEDLARNIYAYFNCSAKRRAQLAQFQSFLDLDVLQMLHPSQTRWLSLNAVVDRIVQHWEALRLYFDDQWIAHKLKNSEAIHVALNDPSIKAYFLFLAWVLPKFTTMNKLFQSSTVVITNLHERMTLAYEELLQTYLKREYINSMPLADLDPAKNAAFIPVNMVYMGVGVMTHLSRPEVARNSRLILEFQTNCRNFLAKACLEIKNRYNFSDPILADLKYFNPATALDPLSRDAMPSIAKLATIMPRCAPQNNVSLQKIDDEWRRLPNCASSLPAEITNTSEPDKFWHKLLVHEDECGILEFKALPKFVLAVLSLPHSNADCERQFSKINNIKTKSRNRLITSTINGVVLADQAVRKRKGCCINFKPTKIMRDKMTKKVLYQPRQQHQVQQQETEEQESDEEVVF